MALAALAVLVPVGLVSCSSDDSSADPGDPSGAQSGGAATGIACELLSQEALQTAFGDEEVPDGKFADWGEGMSECRWDGEQRHLMVSEMPEETYMSNFADAMMSRAASEVEGVDAGALGDEVRVFNGLVGVGRGETDGASVAITSGGNSVVVGVNTPSDDEPADTQLALDLVATTR